MCIAGLWLYTVVLTVRSCWFNLQLRRECYSYLSSTIIYIYICTCIEGDGQRLAAVYFKFDMTQGDVTRVDVKTLIEQPSRCPCMYKHHNFFGVCVCVATAKFAKTFSFFLIFCVLLSVPILEIWPRKHHVHVSDLLYIYIFLKVIEIALYSEGGHV